MREPPRDWAFPDQFIAEERAARRRAEKLRRIVLLIALGWTGCALLGLAFLLARAAG